MTRLAIVVSHPIQHFVHLYRALGLTDDIEVKVFFCSRIGISSYFDRQMNTVIQWSGDMLSGYDHAFLDEADQIKVATFSSIDNPSVAAALDAFAPQAVMIYGYAQKTQLRVLWWASRCGVPVLMAGDGNSVQERPALKTIIRAATLRALFTQVSLFLTAGDQNEAMLARLGVKPARMVRVPFTIDETAYEAARLDRAARRARIRQQHGIAPDAFVPIMVGKIYAGKRTTDLVRAAALARTSRALHLLFCGDGVDRPALEAEIAARAVGATLAGFINTNELPSYYCAADVLVHPSELDNHPLVCSKAAAIGLPMALSDKVGTIGPTDISRDGENTLVFPCGDTSALARILERLVNEAGLVESMARKSLDIYRQCGLKVSVDGMRAALGRLSRSDAR